MSPDLPSQPLEREPLQAVPVAGTSHDHPDDAVSQSATPKAQPPSIPDHELIRRIGGGSYGEVWLARNVVGTFRAVKIVSRSTFEHDRPFEREFAGIQKFEPISRSHEGLVDLLQVGRNDPAGYFYYVMELADGEEMQNAKCKVQNETPAHFRTTEHRLPILNFEFSILNYRPKTLRSLLRSPAHSPTSPPANSPTYPPTHSPTHPARLPLDECIQLGLSLTSALAYLHGQGLVHRDIKPSNIIFVGGVPKLADVGLVAGVGEAGSYVGTEGFIPPEGPGSPQADLYSLGIVLYQMSTGKSHQDFPEPLADLAAQPDHAHWLEFNAVIHKACRAEVRARYQSAEEMLAELRLLQRGQSVKRKRSAQRRWAFTWKTSIALAAVALAAALGWQLFYGMAFHRLSAPISRPIIPREAKVIAVLPFDNESPDKGDDYLGKQMAEELSTALSRIPSLRVLGRDSAAALKTAPDRRTVAQQRKLAAVLDGRVRKSGTQLHLAVQLINPADGLVLWSDDCDGEIREFSALQTRLAQGVVKALTGKLSDTDRVRLAIKATRNPEAYQLYLEARSFCGEEGIPRPESWDLARARFQSAIDLDPQFAAAHAGLAGCFSAGSSSHKSPKEVLQKALAAAEKAVELDSTLAEAHTALASAKYRLYAWDGAGKEFELAVRLGPNLVSAHKQYAKYLTSQGRFEEAIAHSRKAVELDPDSLALGVSLGWTLFDAHQYDQARKAFETVLKLTPNFQQALEGLGWCHFVNGRPEEALALWGRTQKASSEIAASSQASTQARLQRHWQKELEQSLAQSKRGEYVDPYWIAADYAKAGDTTQAFEWLDRAYEQHSPTMPLVAVECQFDNLHADPRFAALLRKMGLKMPVWKQ